MSRQVIAFIGGGNMAASLVGGLVAGGWPPSEIRVAEPRAERRAELTVLLQSLGFDSPRNAGQRLAVLKAEGYAPDALDLRLGDASDVDAVAIALARLRQAEQAKATPASAEPGA